MARATAAGSRMSPTTGSTPGGAAAGARRSKARTCAPSAAALLAVAQLAAAGVERDRLGARRADVDAEDDRGGHGPARYRCRSAVLELVVTNLARRKARTVATAVG